MIIYIITILIKGCDYLYSIYLDYQNLEANKAIALVPIKSFNISKKIVIGDITIYPKGKINVEEIGKCCFDFTFEEIKTLFYDSVIMAIPTYYAKPLFGISLLPNEKTKFINTVLETAEDVMNVMRFIFCNWDKNSNLPQRAGYIHNMISGFLLYFPTSDVYSYIFDKYVTQNYSLTNELYIDVDISIENLNKYSLVLINESYEVASIIKHAFRIYSNILYMPTSTNKFMQAMSMIEYLANPFEYVKMQDVKTKIIPFSVDSKKKYHEICERFKQLTSLKNEHNEQIGLRTCIVHNGKNLDQLISESYKIDMLLRELQMYVCNFINHIIIYTKYNWDKVVKSIEEKYNQIQNIKYGYEGKYESDVAILIDMNFFNKAIEEVYLWYPQYREVRFDFCKFLILLTMNTNIERKGYQIPVEIFFDKDELIYNSTITKKVSELEGLGFDSEYGEYSIYTFDTSTFDSHQDIMRQFLEGCLCDFNYNIDESGKFNNIVFISDRNNISDDTFIKSTKSHKKIILGRLDNKRTSNYDQLTWLDIQLTIMKTLGIEDFEECAKGFIFDVKDGRYSGA
ncbi:Uncharacterised protein [Clostridioides difficile]|nr:Uncharacterised protein [Clostridioides difficile]